MTEITIWDVQHGSAAYIRSPNGRHIVVDAGVGSYENIDADFHPLYHLWKYYDVGQIDCAILTHPHKDHIEDIENLKGLRPKVFRRPLHLKRSDIITSQTKQSDVPLFEQYIELDRGYTENALGTYNDISNPKNYGDLEIQTFIAKNCPIYNLNNQSIVSVFGYANLKVVIPGDNESESFNELMLRDDFIDAVYKADVLVAPHHGRASGFHEGFVRLVNPRITVISDSNKKDTSVTDKYAFFSRGWDVFSRKDGSSQSRKTVSTHHDGMINIKLGYNNGQPFLNIQNK
jgi:hypothetical protein